MKTPNMIHLLRHPALGLAFATVLGGCTTLPDIPRQGIPSLKSGELHATQAHQPLVEEAETQRPQPTLFMGNDHVVHLPPKPPAFDLQGETVSLNFEQAPLVDVVHAVLGDLLKLNYSIDAPLSGQITLRTSAPIPRDQLLPALESILQANNAAITRDTKGMLHVGPVTALRATSPLIGRADANQPGFSTVIVPLKNIGAQEMAEILKPLAPQEAIIRVDPTRNLLILAGTANQIAAWNELIQSFDIDILKGMSVGIFPLEHASVKEADAAIRLLMGGGTTTDPKSGVTTPLSGIVRVLPIERLNSLLVVTPRAHYLEQVREWIDRLDRAPDNDFEPQLFVYPVQNGTAHHLAQLLNGLFSGLLGNGRQGAVDASRSLKTDSGVAPGLGSTSLTSAATSQVTNVAGLNGTAGKNPQPGLATGASSQGTQTIAQVSLAPQVRVVADDENNALLIYAPRKDYRKIESALKQLDVAPTQVLIEASILEVTLTDDLKYGLEWHLDNALGSGWRGNGQLNLNAGGDIAPIQPGFAYSFVNPAGAVRAILNTLAQKSLLKVISTPSIMVLDNHTATIHVGDQQPIRSSETLTTGGNLTTSIEYKDTGVVLTVRPSVNAGGIVTMNIHQAVTDVGQVDTATGQRSFLQREVGSRVAVRSGETVVIGGLIRDNSSQGKSGIPGLMNIPIMGGLFGTTTDNSTRTELLVMITPRILNTDQDLRAITHEMRERLIGMRMLDSTQASKTNHE